MKNAKIMPVNALLDAFWSSARFSSFRGLSESYNIIKPISTVREANTSMVAIAWESISLLPKGIMSDEEVKYWEDKPFTGVYGKRGIHLRRVWEG